MSNAHDAEGSLRVLKGTVSADQFIGLEPTPLAGKVLKVRDELGLSVSEQKAKPHLAIRRHCVVSTPPGLSGLRPVRAVVHGARRGRKFRAQAVRVIWNTGRCRWRLGLLVTRRTPPGLPAWRRGRHQWLASLEVFGVPVTLELVVMTADIDVNQPERTPFFQSAFHHAPAPVEVISLPLPIPGVALDLGWEGSAERAAETLGSGDQFIRVHLR
jgi:hypothetical protein